MGKHERRASVKVFKIVFSCQGGSLLKTQLLYYCQKTNLMQMASVLEKLFFYNGREIFQSNLNTSVKWLLVQVCCGAQGLSPTWGDRIIYSSSYLIIKLDWVIFECARKINGTWWLSELKSSWRFKKKPKQLTVGMSRCNIDRAAVYMLCFKFYSLQCVMVLASGENATVAFSLPA